MSFKTFELTSSFLHTLKIYLFTSNRKPFKTILSLARQELHEYCFCRLWTEKHSSLSSLCFPALNKIGVLLSRECKGIGNNQVKSVKYKKFIMYARKKCIANLSVGQEEAHHLLDPQTPLTPHRQNNLHFFYSSLFLRLYSYFYYSFSKAINTTHYGDITG